MLKTLLNVKFSDHQSVYRQAEKDAYVHFVDFMDECAGTVEG